MSIKDIITNTEDKILKHSKILGPLADATGFLSGAAVCMAGTGIALYTAGAASATAGTGIMATIAAGVSSVANTITTAIAGNTGLMSALSWVGITTVPATAGSVALFGGIILGTIAIATITGAICKYISKKRTKEKAKVKAYDQIKEETQKSQAKVNNKGMAIQSQKVQISDPQNLESTAYATNEKNR